MIKVFLSGGTHGNWRDRLSGEFPKDVSFFDPTTLRNKNMKEIATIERQWLDECDCLFFYFEKENPSGIGSAFEVGYCVANGLPTLFVDEKRTSHTEWLGFHCTAVAGSFDDGVIKLKELIAELRRTK